ncbi:MAG: sensor histidine kinase, partial [Caulobacteraceae bacterium]
MTTIDRRRRSRRTRDEAREDYLAALSHELRTPLGGVLGLAELLSGTRLDAEQQAYVSSMRDCGRHLLALVSDVLDLAKIDAGKLELLPAPVDVEDLLRGVAELLSPRAHEKGLEIAWAADGLDGQVIADAGRLRQILYNLVGNAVKFTGTGGVLITARAKPSASNGWRIRFSVADTGPGIPAKDRKHIFEPFGQADGSAERRDSTGLGLTVVERLVRAMEGELGLDSAPGKGATFWFEIHAPAAAASGRTSVPSLAGLTVDVVSPCATTRQAAEMQIEASGGRARLFDTMAEARSARPGGPALIDAACEGAAALPGRPCLILIKPEERPTIANSRRVGFAGYLIKPLRRASIAARALAVMGATALTAPGDDERGATRSVRGLRVLLAE